MGAVAWQMKSFRWVSGRTSLLREALGLGLVRVIRVDMSVGLCEWPPTVGVFCEAVTCRVGSEMSVLMEYVFS